MTHLQLLLLLTKAIVRFFNQDFMQFTCLFMQGLRKTCWDEYSCMYSELMLMVYNLASRCCYFKLKDVDVYRHIMYYMQTSQTLDWILYILIINKLLEIYFNWYHFFRNLWLAVSYMVSMKWSNYGYLSFFNSSLLRNLI